MYSTNSRWHKVVLVVLFSSTVSLRLASQDACEPAPAATTELGTRSFVQDVFPISPGGMVYSSDPFPIGVKWVRAQIRIDKMGSGLWRMDVRDRQFRPIDTMLSSDFSNQARFRWTPRIYTQGFFLDIRNADWHNAPRFTVLQYIVMPMQPQRTYYSLKISANPDWHYTDELRTDDATNLEEIRMADAVGLFFSNVPGRGAWSCSGVLVATDLFLTNWHCGGPQNTRDEDMWTPEIQEDAFIDLSWDGDQVSRELRVVDVPSKSKELDYALLRIQPLDRVSLPIPATIRRTPPKMNEPVVLIHHPGSERKAISSCNVLEENHAGWLNKNHPTEITYDCDTEAGSSGAPVFGNGAVLALHHLGFTYGANCKSDLANKGIKISEIVSALPTTLKDELRIVP